MAQSEFAFPAKDDLTDDAFLTEETLALYANTDTLGKNFKDVFPERQQQWELERANLKKVLEKYDVEVQVPRRLTDYENRQEKKMAIAISSFAIPFSPSAIS